MSGQGEVSLYCYTVHEALVTVSFGTVGSPPKEPRILELQLSCPSNPRPPQPPCCLSRFAHSEANAGSTQGTLAGRLPLDTAGSRSSQAVVIQQAMALLAEEHPGVQTPTFCFPIVRVGTLCQPQKLKV